MKESEGPGLPDKVMLLPNITPEGLVVVSKRENPKIVMLRFQQLHGDGLQVGVYRPPSVYFVVSFLVC